MQMKDVRPESFVKQIYCDRCGREASMGEAEFQEFVGVDLKAGYVSIFGDGCDVQIDLCQYCLKASLGPWLRVSDRHEQQRRLDDALSRFDPQKHGGEFPGLGDKSLHDPELSPPQDRGEWGAPPVRPPRPSRALPMRQIWQDSMRLFFAPLTGSIRGIRDEYRRMARLDRARQRWHAQWESRRCTVLERCDAAHEAAGSDDGLAKRSAESSHDRKQRSIGLLKGRLDVPADFDAELPPDVIQDFEGRLTQDSSLTTLGRTQVDPSYRMALIDEALELARNGGGEVARRILCDLVGAWPEGSSLDRRAGLPRDEGSASPPAGAGERGPRED